MFHSLVVFFAKTDFDFACVSFLDSDVKGLIPLRILCVGCIKICLLKMEVVV